MIADREKVMLFDGTNLEGWVKPNGKPCDWDLLGGAMIVAPDAPDVKEKNDALSIETHEDVVLHVEFRTPYMPEATGQWRGNSGVYLQGRYEIQILDSYGIEGPPQDDDCGAMYRMHAPLVNACKPPLEWQTLDAYFRAPRVDASGNVIEYARATVLMNDVLILNNVEMPRPTGNRIRPGVDPDVTKPGPILLQCHGEGDRVSYRNIWIQHLPKGRKGKV